MVVGFSTPSSVTNVKVSSWIFCLSAGADSAMKTISMSRMHKSSAVSSEKRLLMMVL